MPDLITPDLRHHTGVGLLPLHVIATPARLRPDQAARPQVSVHTLTDVPLLRNLEPALARQLAASAVVRQVPRNRLVLDQGSRDAGLYVLLRGQALVVRRNLQGRPLVIDQLRPGDHFGELSAIDGQPQSAAVRCTQPSEVLVIGRAAFNDCLQMSLTLLPALLQVMVQRVRQRNRRIALLALHDVRGCVVQQLLDLADLQDGVPVVRGPICRQSVADMIGASRAMVSRVMMELTRSGAIETLADGSTAVHCQSAIEHTAPARRARRPRAGTSQPAAG